MAPYSPKNRASLAPRLLIGGCKIKGKVSIMRFKQHAPHLLDLREMVEEHNYLTKRIYRLEKLGRLGKEVEPDLGTAMARELILDVGIRERKLAMAQIPS